MEKTLDVLSQKKMLPVGQSLLVKTEEIQEVLDWMPQRKEYLVETEKSWMF